MLTITITPNRIHGYVNNKEIIVLGKYDGRDWSLGSSTTLSTDLE